MDRVSFFFFSGMGGVSISRQSTLSTTLYQTSLKTVICSVKLWFFLLSKAMGGVDRSVLLGLSTSSYLSSMHKGVNKRK